MTVSPIGLHRTELPGTVWPPVSRGASATLAALLGQLAITEKLPPEAIAMMQGRQLAVTATHHQSHNRGFATRLKAAGLTADQLTDLSALRSLAPIGRRDIQSAGAGFFTGFTQPAHGPVNEINSSGSTGEPVKVRKTQLQSLLWSAMTVRDLVWHGHDFGARITTIRPQVESYYERKGWGRPVDDLFESGPAQGIPLQTDIPEQMRLLRQFEPNVLVAFPSNLEALAGLWETQGWGPASLRSIRTLGETVGPELRERIAKLGGVAIEDHYSAQEVGSIALQCPVSGLFHIMAETVIVEVLNERGEPCGEGETGRIVISDLHNLATPLIRYEIGDYGEVGDACPCGRTLPTLRRILGRERNLVLLPDGRRFWPLLGEMGRRFEPVTPHRQFQLIQHTPTTLEFRMVTDERVTPAQLAHMTGVIQEMFGYPFEIDFVPFEGKLPIGPNGKFEQFMCRVPST